MTCCEYLYTSELHLGIHMRDTKQYKQHPILKVLATCKNKANCG